VSVAEAEVLMYLSLLHCPIFGGLEHPHSQIPHSGPTLTLTLPRTLTLPKGKLMCLSLDRAQ
jgi:hypothetical protein